MARLVIDIPDSKLGFFMELIKNLGFIIVREKSMTGIIQDDTIDIPKTHQKLVMDRFNKTRKDPDRLMDWDEAKRMLKS
jgi:hypothetical protein